MIVIYKCSSNLNKITCEMKGIENKQKGLILDSKTEKEILQILDSNNFISIEEVKKELNLITS